MKNSNWVCQAINVFLAAIMLSMYTTTQTVPALAGEYDLKGSIEAAKKAEVKLRQAATENRKKAASIKKEMYAESKSLYE